MTRWYWDPSRSACRISSILFPRSPIHQLIRSNFHLKMIQKFNIHRWNYSNNHYQNLIQRTFKGCPMMSSLIKASIYLHAIIWLATFFQKRKFCEKVSQSQSSDIIHLCIKDSINKHLGFLYSVKRHVFLKINMIIAGKDIRVI